MKKTKNADKIIVESIYEPQVIMPKHKGGKSTYSDKRKNYKKAANNLDLIIALNFEERKSWFVTITLKNPYAQELKFAKKLIRRLNRFLISYYEKQGLDFKTLGVIERGTNCTKRLHFHLLIPVITFAPLNLALRKKFFGVFGCVYKKRFYDKNSLGKYLLKNRLEAEEFEVCRFSCNLERPDVKIERINSCENPLLELRHTGKIEPPKGYSWNRKRTYSNGSYYLDPLGSTRYDKNK